MIYINLIPSNLWFLNLRKMLPIQEWKKVSERIRSEFNWQCYCCNISINQIKNKSFFHAHEYWIFNREKKEVSLAAIVCVCKKCHDSIHIGYSSVKKNYFNAFNHLKKVNQWSQEDTKNYVEYNFEEWSKNNKIDWVFNINSFSKWLNKEQVKMVSQFLNEMNKTNL